MQAFEYEQEDGNRTCIPPWKFGERVALMDDNQRDELRHAWATVDQFTNEAQQFIPAIVSREGYVQAKDTFAALWEHRRQGT
jgi:hypothetical protein